MAGVHVVSFLTHFRHVVAPAPQDPFVVIVQLLTILWLVSFVISNSLVHEFSDINSLSQFVFIPVHRVPITFWSAKVRVVQLVDIGTRDLGVLLLKPLLEVGHLVDQRTRNVE
jgi:hypothetical protein